MDFSNLIVGVQGERAGRIVVLSITLDLGDPEFAKDFLEEALVHYTGVILGAELSAVEVVLEGEVGGV